MYWFLPTRPRFAGGRPVFLCEDLGIDGVGTANDGRGGSGLRLFRFEGAVRGAGSGEGSESSKALVQASTLGVLH